MKRVMMAISTIVLVLMLALNLTAQSLITADVAINCNVVGAKVYLNNILSGQTPLSIKLKIGKYSVKIEAPGYQTFQASIDVTPTGNKLFSFTLVPVSTPQVINPTGAGNLIITSNLPATVYIDSYLIGGTPFNKSVKAGYHKVRVVAKDKQYGYQDFDVTIVAGMTSTLNVVFGQVIPPQPPQPVGYTIKIQSNVQAQVYIENNYAGTTPVVVTLQPGTYKLKLIPTVANYKELNQIIQVTNQNNSYMFNLEPLMTNGFIKVKLPSSAKLYINGQRYNFHNNEIISLPAGQYTIEVDFGGIKINRTVNVRSNETVTIRLVYDLTISSNDDDDDD